MPKIKIRRSVAIQRSLDIRLQHRRKARKGPRGRFKMWGLSTLFLASSCGLFFLGWKIRGRVFDLRVGRAHELAMQVLRQTQRSPAEQKRYAAAIARNSVEKGLSPA